MDQTGSIPEADRLPYWFIALFALPVLGLNLFTWLYFAVGCGVSENASQDVIDFCNGHALLVPSIGALAPLAGAAAARVRTSGRPLAIGCGLGVVLGASLWISMGDPAGNFGPLF